MLDTVAHRTLRAGRGWWLTAGVVFTLWQASGVARAVMGALSITYGDGDDRPFVRRYLISFALGVAVAICVLTALVIVRFGSAILGLEHLGWLADAVMFVVRWGAALALLSTAVGAAALRARAPGPAPLGLVRVGAVRDRLGRDVGRVRLLRDDVADYGSIFGSLATVFLLMTYLYLSACAFLIGAEVDAIVRHGETGSRSGG